MKLWKRDVSSLTQREILGAVRNDAWQRFRRSLKGLSTEEKLDHLDSYLERRSSNGKVSRKDIIRVDNYINALLRGGQLRHSAIGIIVQR